MLGDGRLGEGRLGEGKLGEGRLGDGKLGDGKLGEGGLGEGRLGEGVPLPEEGMRGIGGEGVRGIGNWTAQPQLSTVPINRATVSLPGVGRFGWRCALRFIGLHRVRGR